MFKITKNVYFVLTFFVISLFCFFLRTGSFVYKWYINYFLVALYQNCVCWFWCWPWIRYQHNNYLNQQLLIYHVTFLNHMYICVVPVRIYVNVDYVPQIYYDSLTKINTPCFWLSILLPKWRIEINKLLTCSSVFKAAKSTTKISSICTLLVHSKSTQSLLKPESLVMKIKVYNMINTATKTVKTTLLKILEI